MITTMQQIIQELLVGNVLLYIIVGGIFAMVVGAFTIDRNGSIGIIFTLPICGGLVAPTVAFLVAVVTDTTFAFSLPGLILPLICVLMISMLLSYGYSLEPSAVELPFKQS